MTVLWQQGDGAESDHTGSNHDDVSHGAPPPPQGAPTIAVDRDAGRVSGLCPSIEIVPLDSTPSSYERHGAATSPCSDGAVPSSGPFRCPPTYVVGDEPGRAARRAAMPPYDDSAPLSTMTVSPPVLAT